MTADFNQDQLIQAAQAGDRDALARLLMHESPRLHKRVAERLQLNPFADFSADDVLQEVFVDVFRGFETFRPEEAAGFSGWVQKVSDNRLASMLRERSRKKRGGDYRRARGKNELAESAAQLVTLLADEAGVRPSQEVARDELVQAVQVGIAALPDEQRQAMNYYLDQRTLDSTADAMQKTKGAVRGLLHRAKLSLRDTLEHSTSWFVQR